MASTYVSRSFNVLSSVSHSVGGLSLTASGGALQVGGANLAVESYADPAGTAATLDAVITTNYIAADVVVSSAFAAADATVTANYIAADAVVTDAFVAADAVVSSAFAAADAVVSSSANSYTDSAAAACNTYADGVGSAAISAAATAADSAISAAVSASAVASVVNLALTADADLSSTPLSKSGGYWFVDGSTADRTVTLPGSANVPGCVMNFMNVGATNILNLNTGVGILKSIAPGDGLKCVANGANWYFFSC